MEDIRAKWDEKNAADRDSQLEEFHCMESKLATVWSGEAVVAQ